VEDSISYMIWPFVYSVIPFGLANAPATFHDGIETIVRDMLNRELLIYMQYFLMYSATVEEHTQIVLEVLHQPREFNLAIAQSICIWHVSTVEFLGYFVSCEGIEMALGKIGTILGWPKLICKQDIQMILGFANFYRQFFEGFAERIKPITNLLRNGVP